MKESDYMEDIGLLWTSEGDYAERVTAALEEYELAHIQHPERQQKKEAAKGMNGVYAVRGDELLGGITYYTHNDWVFLVSGFVWEQWRGLGIYRAIMDAIEKRSREIGMGGIFVSTYDVEAPALYEKLGFKRGCELTNCPQGNTSLDFYKPLPDTQEENGGNKPLTLDELLKMDGEPIYCQFGDGVSGWAVVEIDEGGHVQLYGPEIFVGSHEEPDTDFLNMEFDDPQGHFGLHILGWRAYRHKPEGVEK